MEYRVLKEIVVMMEILLVNTHMFSVNVHVSCYHNY